MERQQFARLKPLIIFFIAFTAGFLFFAATLKYTFPFLAGFLLALAVQPLIRLIRKKSRMKPGLISGIATLVAFIVLFGLLFLLGYWLVYEISNLIDYLSTLSKSGFGQLSGPVSALLNQAGEYLSKIDAQFVEQNREQILSIAQSGAGVATTILSSALKFLTSLPAIFTMLIVMIFSTYFFSKDMGTMKKRFVELVPKNTVEGLKTASKHGANISGRYVLSYLLVYFITFVETLIVFSALSVPYPLVLSIVTGIADILPVLGPGIIYIPMAVIYLATGDVFRAVALLICWLLITAIRQIIEPKLVSSSINIHPLYMLAAIYFALVAGNFWVLIYFSVLALLYKILTQAGLLPRLFGSDPEEAAQDTPQNVKTKQTK